MLFVYAGLMVGAMYLYWELYTRPFRPLQEAINAQYPNSMPRVIGGKHKSHREGSKPTLRVVVTVDFDPLPAVMPEKLDNTQPGREATPAIPASVDAQDEDRKAYTEGMKVDERVHERFRSLLKLIQQHHGLESYEFVEIFLEYRRPEKNSRTLSSTRSKAEWFEAYPEAALAPPNQP